MKERLSHIIHSRSFGLTLVWILFILALYGTYMLSKNIERGGNNGASLFMATGKTHEVSVYKDRAESTLLHMSVGDEVLFIVKDQSHHNIAEERSNKNDARLESGEIGEGESYSLIFKSKGVFSFYDRMNQDIHITLVID
jgi:hypothetical protein